MPSAQCSGKQWTRHIIHRPQYAHLCSLACLPACLTAAGGGDVAARLQAALAAGGERMKVGEL